MDDWRSNLTTIPSKSLLISTSGGKLIRKYCPVPAKCIQDVANIKEGETIQIDGIHADDQYLILYQIDGLNLPHEYFIII